ncbi:MAG TPA: roadblock/LC7 domain-containing protein [Vulgatibacter sp.]
MGFREQLEEICRVDGAVAASIMGFDGIAIETVTARESDLDVETLMVEYSGLIGQVRQAAEMMQAGALTEVSIGTEQLTTHLRPINDDFFLVLAMSPDGNTGKGRYLLRVTAPRLVGEL